MAKNTSLRDRYQTKHGGEAIYLYYYNSSYGNSYHVLAVKQENAVFYVHAKDNGENISIKCPMDIYYDTNFDIIKEK